MIFAAPALILPPEKPAIVQAHDLKGLPSPQELRRRETAIREGTFPFPFIMPGTSGTWQQIFSNSLSGGNDTLAATYTGRLYFNNSALTAIAGGTQVRVTFKAGSGTWAPSAVYIGNQGTASDIDYTGSIAQLLFSGSGSFSLSSGSTILSDAATFSWDSTKGIVIAVYSASQHSWAWGSLSGCGDKYKGPSLNDTTTNPGGSGYTTDQTSRAIGVTKIEVFA